jgi:hypothetical protein
MTPWLEASINILLLLVLICLSLGILEEWRK